MIPQWVEFGSAVVHDFGEVGVEVLRIQRRLGGGVVLADVEGVEEAVEILHVRNVAAETHDYLIVELPQALDIREAGE